jgi:hypothetical protein
MMRLVLGLAMAAVAAGCARGSKAGPGTFAGDLAFLQKHVETIVLSDAAGQAQVAVAPAYQGRVMTSTAEGPGGASFGWINRDLVASGKFLQHINCFGGEDRFWMGPEGGQFSIFFAKGAAFDLEHWFTPAAIDTEPFEVVGTSRNMAQFRRRIQLTNYSGTKFDVEVTRQVRLLSAAEAAKALGVAPAAGLKMVAYESVNRITNAGREAWKKETGLLSVWILGMFNPSPATTIVVPIKGGTEADLGKAVTDDYFGKVPAERLVVKGDVVYFSGDGKYRSKIGIGPKRVKPVLGSYDAAGKVLTLVQFTLPAGATDYVNSLWKIQDAPFAGDVANSYNDGPASPGAKPMGPFYELESSSPAAALEPGKSLEHVHRTIHLKGDEKDLDAVARAVLGVGLQEITTALPR